MFSFHDFKLGIYEYKAGRSRFTFTNTFFQVLHLLKQEHRSELSNNLHFPNTMLDPFLQEVTYILSGEAPPPAGDARGGSPKVDLNGKDPYRVEGDQLEQNEQEEHKLQEREFPDLDAVGVRRRHVDFLNGGLSFRHGSRESKEGCDRQQRSNFPLLCHGVQVDEAWRHFEGKQTLEILDCVIPQVKIILPGKDIYRQVF